MTIAVALTAVFFNTVLVRLLPHLEFIMLILREFAQRQLSPAYKADFIRLCRLLRLCVRLGLHGSERRR